MDTSNADIERAEARVAAERDQAVGKARAAVEQEGTYICEDCGEQIDSARLHAAPFARRCVTCQQNHEK